ncbi:hypothetical protein MPTK1_4g21130 [Marchantia polymorpha subsp. ruderalis]|uniref:Coiled-coil domain-containing protein SCD2 n=2 Tax=Marchantia polymorpha TaxID=3197 RepID=A0AAF6BC77_MARPO|nr:hypothetical protein MARPO_0101s0059 [Marchantia polymorpha]BBN09611.1 hypothetical protein Mp_4g21130 [Marchantia polymorpha subsp. ruderalis]|eukprot:PTQ32272.1 hypothetical protein MARPO_0101s0059 [Marchantia polymorpha]
MANADGNYGFTSRSRNGSSEAGGAPSGPHHVRSASHASGLTPARRTQGYAKSAAAARLAQVMASHSDDYDEDELQFERQPMPSYGASRDSSPRVVRPPFGGLGSRDPSPRVVRPFSDSIPAPRFTAVPMARLPQRSTKMPPSLPPTLTTRTSDVSIESISDIRSSNPLRRPSTELNPSTHLDVPRGDSSSLRNGNREPERREEAALRDEIDLLEEDKEILKTRLTEAEQKLAERDLRMKELEKQVANLGEGISMEARLLSRKEAALRQREAALKAAKEQVKDTKDDEIAALRLDADTLKAEAQSAAERAEAAEKEVRGLRSVTHRMVLTQEEMEEMVLKRCWLARYWGLAARYGVLAEVASSKHEHWSALAPLPLEVVISAGHSESTSSTPGHRKTPSIRDLNDLTSGEGNIEGMLAVEKGLRELASLKVEQAVMLAMAENQHPNGTVRGELTAEEVEDLQFKQAWLVYFWRRAKNYKVEKDISEEKLTYWRTRSNQAPSSHDIVDVERGLLELQKLGIEEQLWEASRKEIAAQASGRLVDED